MSDKGQITIPDDIWILLDIKKRDRFAMAVKDDKLQTKIPRCWLDDVLNHTESSLKKIWLNDKVWDKCL